MGVRGYAFSKPSILEKLDNAPQMGSIRAVTSNGIHLLQQDLEYNLSELRKEIDRDFHFKGTVASLSDLPTASIDHLNDVYYVRNENCLYSCGTPSANVYNWYQASLDESQYLDLLGTISLHSAEPYDGSKDYHVGDRVVNTSDSKLYVCKHDSPADQVFQPKCWVTCFDTGEVLDCPHGSFPFHSNVGAQPHVWWTCNYVYRPGYVDSVSIYLDSPAECSIAFISKSDLHDSYLLYRTSVSGLGEVTVPVNKYIEFDFWIAFRVDTSDSMGYYQYLVSDVSSDVLYLVPNYELDGIEEGNRIEFPYDPDYPYDEQYSTFWLPSGVGRISYIIDCQVKYGSDNTIAFPESHKREQVLDFGSFDFTLTEYNRYYMNNRVYSKGYIKSIQTCVDLNFVDPVTNIPQVSITLVKHSNYEYEQYVLYHTTVDVTTSIVNIPIHQYIDNDFYVAIKSSTGLRYHTYYVSSRSTEDLYYRSPGYELDVPSGYLPALYVPSEADPYDPKDIWWPKYNSDDPTAPLITYVFPVIVNYANSEDLVEQPYNKLVTINQMYVVGDSQTAGWIGTGQPSPQGSRWWRDVGRYLGYDVQVNSTSGMGYVYKSGGNNGATIASSVDFRNYSVVVYALGTNDYLYYVPDAGTSSGYREACVPLGEIDDVYDPSSSNNTFSAAVNYVIQQVYRTHDGEDPPEGSSWNRRPVLILVTPIERYVRAADDSYTYGMMYENPDHHTLKDYCERIIDICKKYGVLYVDRTTSVLNQMNISRMTYDGLHPHTYGYKLLGAEMCGKLGALLRPYVEWGSEEDPPLP